MERRHDEDWLANHRDYPIHEFSAEYKAQILQEYAERDARRAADEAIYARVNGHYHRPEAEGERHCSFCRNTGLVLAHPDETAMMDCPKCGGHGVLA